MNIRRHMQPSMASNLLLPFDSFYKTWKDRPKDKIVEKLLEIGTVSTLTEVKFKLCSECQQVSQFPQGDMYTRRKPKGNSTFSTLEERLAEDIWQLMVCMDTGVVQPAIKSMFKSGEDSLAENIITVSDSSDNIAEQIFGTPILNATQGRSDMSGLESRLTHKNCSDRIASIEADVFILKDKFTHDINDILAQLSQKKKTIEKQESEINQLKSENLTLKSRLLTLEKRAPNLNKEARQTYSEVTMNPNNKQKNNDANGATSSKNTIPVSISTARPTPGKSPSIESIEKTKNNAASNMTNGNKTDKSVVNAIVDEDNVHTNSDTNRHLTIEPNQNKPQPNLSKTPDHVPNVDLTSEADGDGFVGVKRKRRHIKRFFLSGISDTVTHETIIGFLEKREIQPTQLRIFPSRRKGTISAKLNVNAKDCSVISQKDFWPAFVSCKPWLTKNKLDTINQDKQTNQSHE